MADSTIQTIKMNGQMHVNIKNTSQGVMAIIEEYPIVVEASNIEELSICISKAMASYFINYPKEITETIKISDLTA